MRNNARIIKNVILDLSDNQLCQPTIDNKWSRQLNNYEIIFQEQVQYTIRDISSANIQIFRKEINDTSFNTIAVETSDINLHQLDCSFNILDYDTVTDVSCVTFTIPTITTSKPHQFLEIIFNNSRLFTFPIIYADVEVLSVVVLVINLYFINGK